MRRYYRALGSVGIGSASVTAYIVIKTDEVSDAAVTAQGFAAVPDDLSDDQVKARFGVSVIYEVTDSTRGALTGCVQ